MSIARHVSVVTLASSMLILAVSCDSELPHSDDNQLADLAERFSANTGEQAAELAAIEWFNCAENAPVGATDCANWEDGKTTFHLLAVKSESGETAPVIESMSSNNPKDAGVIIHLTGGTDDPPLSNLGDTRFEVYGYLHDRNFKVASIGYWGTSFRTTLSSDEIVMASKDLALVYNYYSRACECEPLIIAESLGAGVLFHYLSRNKPSKLNFLAVAPVMTGIPSAAQYYQNTLTPKELEWTRKRSNIYGLDEHGENTFLGARLVNPIEHLSKFALTEESRPNLGGSFADCSRFVLGRNDPLSRGFDQWDHPAVVAIPEGKHNILSSHASQFRSVLIDFLTCGADQRTP